MSDYAAVVRTNHHRTTGYLLASSPPCIKIRNDEIQRINRKTIPLTLAELKDLEPEGSWLLGVILCPGDDTTEVSRFAHRTHSPHRIRFFAHPKTEISTTLESWKAAGHHKARIDLVASWKQLHPLFGLALNDQVYHDFAP